MSDRATRLEIWITIILGSLMGILLIVGYAFAAFMIVSSLFHAFWGILEAFSNWQYKLPAISTALTGFFLQLIYREYRKRFPPNTSETPESRRSLNPNAARDLAQPSAMRGPHFNRRDPPPTQQMNL